MLSKCSEYKNRAFQKERDVLFYIYLLAVKFFYRISPIFKFNQIKEVLYFNCGYSLTRNCKVIIRYRVMPQKWMILSVR